MILHKHTLWSTKTIMILVLIWIWKSQTHSRLGLGRQPILGVVTYSSFWVSLQLSHLSKHWAQWVKWDNWTRSYLWASVRQCFSSSLMQWLGPNEYIATMASLSALWAHYSPNRTLWSKVTIGSDECDEAIAFHKTIDSNEAILFCGTKFGFWIY